MGKTRRPLIIAIILFVATLTLVGATFAAASLPSSGGLAAKSENIRPATMPMPTTPAEASKKPVASAQSESAPKTPKSTPKSTKPKVSTKDPITYTVKRGDTLYDIAAWFKQHGYRKLYAANKSIIGANPNLIFPGQKITISNGKMTMEKSS